MLEMMKIWRRFFADFSLSPSLLCKLIYFAGCRHRHRSYTVVCMLACFPAALCERRENLKYQDFRVKRYEYIKFSLSFSFFSIVCHCISFRILFVVRIAWIVFSSKFFHRDNSLTPLILTLYFLHRLLPPINLWYDFCCLFMYVDIFILLGTAIFWLKSVLKSFQTARITVALKSRLNLPNSNSPWIFQINFGVYNYFWENSIEDRNDFFIETMKIWAASADCHAAHSNEIELEKLTQENKKLNEYWSFMQIGQFFRSSSVILSVLEWWHTFAACATFLLLKLWPSCFLKVENHVLSEWNSIPKLFKYIASRK